MAPSSHAPARVQVQTVATRNIASWLTFLDQVEAFAPPGEAYLIADALPLHWSVDTMLWNWGLLVSISSRSPKRRRG